MNDPIVQLLTYLILVFLIIFVRVAQGDWLTAGNAFSIVWLAVLSIKSIVSPNLPISEKTYLFITAICIMGAIGSALGFMLNSILKRGKRITKQYTWNYISVRNIYFATLVVATISTVLMFLQTANNYGFIVDNFFELSNRVSVARYTDIYTLGLVGSFALVMTYLCTALGGLYAIAYSFRRKNLLLSTLWIVPSLIILSSTGTRATVIYAIVFYIAFIVSGLILVKKKTFSLLQLTVMLTAASLFLIVFAVGSYFLRWNITDTNRIGNSYEGIIEAYVSAAPAAFSQWFETYYSETPKLGLRTFVGIAGLLGLENRLQGIYTDAATFETSSTNIYTAFRPLIEDFDVVGALLFVGIVSIIAGRTEASLRLGNGSVIGVLSVYWSYVLSTPFTSVFSYNNLCLTLACMVIMPILLTRTRFSKVEPEYLAPSPLPPWSHNAK